MHLRVVHACIRMCRYTFVHIIFFFGVSRDVLCMHSSCVLQRVHNVHSCVTYTVHMHTPPPPSHTHTAVLVLFLHTQLKFDENSSTAMYHGFTMLCYLFPLLGAIISDSCLGKYWSVRTCTCTCVCIRT